MLLTEYFEKCQENGGKVESVVRELLPRLKTMKSKEIVAELMWHIQQVFAADVRVTAVSAVEKILDFVTMVIVTAGDIEKRAAAKKKTVEDEACNDVFERFSFHLLKAKLLQCENANVRRLCCQLFARLMAGLPSDTDVSEELFGELSEAICDRLTDRAPAVRQAAAKAAWRLQDPYAEDCPVATALAVMASNDHHYGCRLAAVETVHIPTLLGTPAVIGRLSDVCEAVRRGALRRLSQRQEGTVISVRVLTPEHVRTVLSRIVCEPSAKLRQSYCQQLVISRWLDEDCRGDICSFLALINVETCPDLGRRTLQFIFSSEPDRLEKIANSFIVPTFADNGTTSTSLTPERIFSWAVLLDSVWNARCRNAVDELFARLLPVSEDKEATAPSSQAFVRFVVTYLSQLFDSPSADVVELHSGIFVAEHLLNVLRHYCRAIDDSEVEKLLSVIIDVLSRDEVHPRFVDLLTKMFCDILGNGVQAVTRVAGVISELLDPDHTPTGTDESDQANKSPKIKENPDALREAEVKIAALRIKLNEMRDELDELVRLERYEEAADCRERISEVKEELADAVANKLHASSPAHDEPNEDESFDADIGTQQLAKQRQNVIERRPHMAVRLLSILGTCLSQCRPALPSGNGLITELCSLFDDFVVCSVATPQPVVRAAALRVLGQCCCIDRDIAVTLHSTFIVQLQLDVQTQSSSDLNFSEITDGPIAAMRVLTDIVLCHGFDVFSSGCEVANAIVHKLSVSDTSIQRAAGESLALLLLSGRCPRKQVPGLMSRLVHFWFDADLAVGRDLDPHSELLRAVLAAFFRMYPTQSASSLTAFAESLFPTLRLVDDDNVFSKVKPHSVAAFFGQKISPSHNPDLPIDVHSQASLIQQNISFFMLTAVMESVAKLKQREEQDKQKDKENAAEEDKPEALEMNDDETKNADMQEQPSNDNLRIKELLWYRVITVASCSFVVTVQLGPSTKQSARLSDMYSLISRLLKEQFEWKLPSALVRRRCRKDLENFAKNLATALHIEHNPTTSSGQAGVVTSAVKTVTDNTPWSDASVFSPSRNAKPSFTREDTILV